MSAGNNDHGTYVERADSDFLRSKMCFLSSKLSILSFSWLGGFSCWIVDLETLSGSYSQGAVHLRGSCICGISYCVWRRELLLLIVWEMEKKGFLSKPPTSSWDADCDLWWGFLRNHHQWDEDCDLGWGFLQNHHQAAENGRFLAEPAPSSGSLRNQLKWQIK